MTDWQDISLAPTDGTKVLGKRGDVIRKTAKRQSGPGWFYVREGLSTSTEIWWPAEWRPLSVGMDVHREKGS